MDPALGGLSQKSGISMGNGMGNSKCPNCGKILDGVKVVRYTSSFPCPFCKTELRVPKYYVMLGGWISLGISITLSLALGFRGASLILAICVFALPSMFSFSFFQRKLFPPRLALERIEILPPDCGV
jgi:hypothetical protein